MRKSRYTEEQIIGFIKQADAGVSVADLCRREGCGTAMFYKWQAKFGGMGVSEARRCVSWSLRTPSSRSYWPRPC